MERDFRRGYLEIDFPPAPFVSPLRLLADAVRLWVSKLGFLDQRDLLVYLPGHLLFQFAAYLFDIPSGGMLSAFLLMALDLILSSLAVPAVVYGLVRKAGSPSVWDALRWGRRQWMRILGNQVKVEITVILYGALLVVPGIVAMVRLSFVPLIIAIEGGRQPEPFARSRSLADGRFWRIFLVLLPIGILDLAGNFLLLDRIPKVDDARIFFAIAESLLAIAGQLGTAAALLMYLGIAEPARRKPRSCSRAVQSRAIHKSDALPRASHCWIAPACSSPPCGTPRARAPSSRGRSPDPVCPATPPHLPQRPRGVPRLPSLSMMSSE